MPDFLCEQEFSFTPDISLRRSQVSPTSQRLRARAREEPVDLPNAAFLQTKYFFGKLHKHIYGFRKTPRVVPVRVVRTCGSASSGEVDEGEPARPLSRSSLATSAMRFSFIAALAAAASCSVEAEGRLLVPRARAQAAFVGLQSEAEAQSSREAEGSSSDRADASAGGSAAEKEEAEEARSSAAGSQSEGQASATSQEGAQQDAGEASPESSSESETEESEAASSSASQGEVSQQQQPSAAPEASSPAQQGGGSAKNEAAAPASASANSASSESESAGPSTASESESKEEAPSAEERQDEAAAAASQQRQTEAGIAAEQQQPAPESASSASEPQPAVASKAASQAESSASSGVQQQQQSKQQPEAPPAAAEEAAAPDSAAAGSQGSSVEGAAATQRPAEADAAPAAAPAAAPREQVVAPHVHAKTSTAVPTSPQAEELTAHCILAHNKIRTARLDQWSMPLSPDDGLAEAARNRVKDYIANNCQVPAHMKLNHLQELMIPKNAAACDSLSYVFLDGLSDLQKRTKNGLPGPFNPERKDSPWHSLNAQRVALIIAETAKHVGCAASSGCAEDLIFCEYSPGVRVGEELLSKHLYDALLKRQRVEARGKAFFASSISEHEVKLTAGSKVAEPDTSGSLRTQPSFAVLTAALLMGFASCS
ncbi:hypothetical protein Esti_000734 [Eimeria stiedai]